MNRNTGESPGENRGPLLLCFVCLHHPVGAGSCPACRLFCHASGRAPVGAGVPDGPFFTLPSKEYSAPAGAGHFWPQRPANFSFSCLRRPHFFQQRKKWGKERRQKPMVFGIPFVRSQPRRKKAHAESLLSLSPLPLPRAAGKCRILPPWNSVPPRGT